MACFFPHLMLCVQYHLAENAEANVREDNGERAWELAAMQEWPGVAQESWALPRLDGAVSQRW